MEIRPFKEYQDVLFTDYIMQLFNAHCSENSQEMITFLISSLEDDAKNPVFLPGLVYGSMIHMFLMMQEIAQEKGVPMGEAIDEYVSKYSEKRINLAKMLGNRPEYASDLIASLPEEDLEF